MHNIWHKGVPKAIVFPILNLTDIGITIYYPTTININDTYPLRKIIKL